jgi:hypothetical protein
MTDIDSFLNSLTIANSNTHEKKNEAKIYNLSSLTFKVDFDIDMLKPSPSRYI